MQEQQEKVHDIESRIRPFEALLDEVVSTEQECVEANVDENDYTVFTFQDLAFELELVVQSIHKKITFIDNQVHSMILPHGWST